LSSSSTKIYFVAYKSYSQKLLFKKNFDQNICNCDLILEISSRRFQNCKKIIISTNGL
jgi:hypothetical protein